MSVNQKADDENGQPKTETPQAKAVNVGKVNSKGDTQNPEHNMKKRKPLSRFECWIIALTIVGILVAGFTGAAIYWQASIGAQTLTEIERGERPWVGMNGEVSLLQFSSENGISRMVVGYKSKNFGASPALNVITWLDRPIADANNYPLAEAKVKESCQSAERLITQTGDLLLPSAEKPDTFRFSDRQEYPRKFVIPGCIVYRDTLGGVHHTQLCYWIDLAANPKPDNFSTCWFQSAD